MKRFSTIKETRSFVLSQREQGLTIGFVPTMGALHPGHISLVEKAVNENDVVICSIFVNPIQFNNPEDLKKYPRTLEKDLKMLQEAGCTAVFVPSVEEMYPEEVQKTYDFGELANVMEGAFRPGHFNGVAIVVNKLFDITLPHRAYFGEKDFQQLQIIKALVRIENLTVEIVPCPISREADGLARSSRNERLTPEMREAAPFIFKTLKEAKSMATNSTASQITAMVEHNFSAHPLLKLEYFSIASGNDLQAVPGAISAGNMGFIAVFAGAIRLIDNIQLI
ncbi:MAG: pantoate--beta-alanine ligase [Lentimicrobium sp.]|jgi:pantoate--beta-alanine ligase|nr:pantoate--beta-alanine ligase [Lentimicrobium sp.]